MRTSLAVWMLAVAALAGCAASPAGPRHQHVATRWGTYALDDVMQLRVTSLGLSQMRYELRHVPSNRVLLREIGQDSKGWFFVWDDRGRLWAFWPEVGIVVWAFDAEGHFQRQVFKPGRAWLGDAPPEVSQHLPDWAKKALGAAPDS